MEAPDQGDRPVSADADDQPERWRAALWRAGGWTHKGEVAAEKSSTNRDGSFSGSSTAGEQRHLEQVISLLGFGRYQEQVLLILVCMQLADGMEATLWWTFERVMRERWDVTDIEYRVGCCAAGICFAAGAFFGGRLADVHGRHLVLFFSGAAYLTSSFLSCFAFSPWSLLALRCACSVSLGCRLPASLALAAELLPCTWRARGALLLPGVGAPMGGVLLLLIWQLAQLARLQNEAHGWRLVLAACFVIDAVVFYFFRITMAESPFFLRQRGRLRECAALLAEVAEINDCVLPDDDQPISQQVEPEDAGDADLLRSALSSVGRVAAALWLCCAVGATCVIYELVEAEGVVFNRVGSLGSLQHGTHVAIIYVGAAYLSVILLELPRLGFRGSLLLLVVPALVSACSLALVPPSQGTAAFFMGVAVAVLLIAALDLSVGMISLTTATRCRASTLGALVASLHLVQAAVLQFVVAASPHVQPISVLAAGSTACGFAFVLSLALSSDGGDSVTLGALDTGDHDLAVMQGGAAGTWDWGLSDLHDDTPDAAVA